MTLFLYDVLKATRARDLRGWLIKAFECVHLCLKGSKAIQSVFDDEEFKEN